MRFPLTSLIRLGSFALLGLTALAIGLGRNVEAPRSWRSASLVSHVSLNGLYFTADEPSSRWLDPSSGTMTRLALPYGEDLDFGSCSPWKDETGQCNVVGRWSRRNGQQSARLKEAFGLARLRFPSGEVLDRISTEIVPVGNPCWYPAPEARVLFAAGDGTLNMLSFDAPEGDRRPEPLAWAIKPPGSGSVYLSEPSWIDDGSPNRCLAVCLRSIEPHGNRQSFTTAQLWWLRLSQDGRSIIAAGRLFSEPLDTRSSELRCPTGFKMADGSFRLGYCRRTPNSQWEMRLAMLEPDRDSKGFSARGQGRLLVDSCLPMPPAFSLDGKWVCALRGEIFNSKELVRLPVDPEREGLASAERTVTEL